MFCFKSTRRRSCIFGALLFVSSKYHYQLCVSLCNVKNGYCFKNCVVRGNTLVFCVYTLSYKVGSTKKRDHVNCWHHNCSFVLSGNSKSRVQWQVRDQRVTPCWLHSSSRPNKEEVLLWKIAALSRAVDELIWAFSFAASRSDVKNVVIFMQVPKLRSIYFLSHVNSITK